MTKIILRKRFYFIVFLVLTVLAGLAYWNWQRNVYSKDNLKFEILGPDAVDFGKNLEYTVKYKNNGDTKLEGAKLVFEYPEDSVVPEGKQIRQEIEAGDIYSGQEKSVKFSGKLIGREGEVKIAKASLSYKPKNLNATYKSETTFATLINFLPLSLELDLPSRIDPGKSFDFDLNYFSNIDYELSDLRISLEYPADFQFKSSKPASLETTEWDIDHLSKAEGGRIQISGQINGSVGNQEAFGAKIGIWKDGEFMLLKEISKSIAIEMPSLSIRQEINGKQDHIASPGERLHYEIFFRNEGSEAITNLSLTDSLSGEMFDFSSLQVPYGASMGNNSVIWDWKNFTGLQYIAPRQENKVEFWINLKQNPSTPTLGNSIITNNVYLNQVNAQFVTKINSKLELSQMGFYQDEIFGNSGPIPPKVGQATTYTVNWQVKNYWNAAENVKVEAILPSYIQLTGNIFPADSRITFDSQSREIVWEIGNMVAGQGINSPPPNISFQIALTPEDYMAGQIPELLKNTVITGRDSWTGGIIRMALEDITADLPNDAAAAGQGMVSF
jgi:uncharacterized repeat protein (TIGR01451 family)